MGTTRPPSHHFTLLYFAAASTFTKKKSDFLPAPLQISSLYDTLEQQYPGIKDKVLSSCAVTVNLEYVDLDDNMGKDGLTIKEGDEVAIIPPCAQQQLIYFPPTVFEWVFHLIGVILIAALICSNIDASKWFLCVSILPAVYIIYYNILLRQRALQSTSHASQRVKSTPQKQSVDTLKPLSCLGCRSLFAFSLFMVSMSVNIAVPFIIKYFQWALPRFCNRLLLQVLDYQIKVHISHVNFYFTLGFITPLFLVLPMKICFPYLLKFLGYKPDWLRFEEKIGTTPRKFTIPAIHNNTRAIPCRCLSEMAVDDDDEYITDFCVIYRSRRRENFPGEPFSCVSGYCMVCKLCWQENGGN